MADFVQLPSGLVIPEAAFAEARRTRPELGEVATTRDGRDITRGYVDGLPLLPPTDSVLAARGAGDYRIYDEVLRDDQVAATFQQRRLAVVSKEWEVIPGGDKRQDKKAAEFLRSQLEHIAWDAVTERMLYGVFYGYAVAECLWARDGQQVVLDALRVRDRRRFGFRPDGRLVLKTTAHPLGEELPERKFWHFACGASHDDEPHGLGLAHWLYWPVLFKRSGLKFWLIFLEKFGMPTGVGRFPHGATDEERNRLLQAVQAIQTDAGIILPEGMELELLEAARSGTADYTALHDRMNAAIAKVVLGQTMTTDNGSSRSQAEVHMDVRQDLVKADADLVCHSANATWVRWLTEWNFPGAQPPRIWRRIEDEPDLKAQAERDQIIQGMGFRPRLDYIRETYGDGWEEARPAEAGAPAGDGQLQDPPPPLAGEGRGGGAAFAESGAHPHPAQAIADHLAQEAAPEIRAWLERIEAMLNAASSLEEFRAMLEAAYDQLPADGLARVMGQALAVAQAAGRFDVEQANGG